MSVAEELAQFLEECDAYVRNGPETGYTKRTIILNVEDQCDSGAVFPMPHHFEIGPKESKALARALRLGAAKGKDLSKPSRTTVDPQEPWPFPTADSTTTGRKHK